MASAIQTNLNFKQFYITLKRPCELNLSKELTKIRFLYHLTPRYLGLVSITLKEISRSFSEEQEETVAQP